MVHKRYDENNVTHGVVSVEGDLMSTAHIKDQSKKK